ncbi:MAG: hypothetical protein ABFR90_01805 [Planctomycetota bacterium]
MKKIIPLLIIAVLVVGLTFAAEEGEKQTKGIKKEGAAPAQKYPDARRGRPSSLEGRRRSPAGRQEMYRQMLSRREEVHKQAIAELEAIKKIAEEEGATRTVEAIQALIDKKDNEYKEKKEKFESQQRERAEQVRQRTGKQGGAAPEKKRDGGGPVRERPVE